MDLVGDVTDADCIIVDDMIDTAGTLCKVRGGEEGGGGEVKGLERTSVARDDDN